MPLSANDVQAPQPDHLLLLLVRHLFVLCLRPLQMPEVGNSMVHS